MDEWRNAKGITRDLKIEIDTKKAIKLSKNRDTYNKKVADRVMAKALIIYIPEDGDPEVELSYASTSQRRKNAPNSTI